MMDVSASTSTPSRTQVVIVTGVSGAGKSTVLRTLEDLGLFCIDNLPTILGHETVSLCENGGISRIALGIDVRVRTFLDSVETEIKELRQNGNRDVIILYCDASDETILRRFSETRRPHTLATIERSRVPAVLDGLQLERTALSPLRVIATRIVDTTHLSVHDLRRLIVDQFGPGSEETTRMSVRIVSFGFKYGSPVDADLLFDVRFLPNPYFISELKSLSGKDLEVQLFVEKLQETKELMQHVLALLRYVIPKYEREGKSYLTIAVGCTGGRHRSVVIAELLAEQLAVAVVHRDLNRDTSP